MVLDQMKPGLCSNDSVIFSLIFETTVGHFLVIDKGEGDRKLEILGVRHFLKI